MNITVNTKDIQEIYNKLRNQTKECPLSEVFPDLPCYYNEWDYEHPDILSQAHAFLSELVLLDLTLPTEPASNSISFQANLKTTPEFLKQALCFNDIAAVETIDSTIFQDEYGEIIFIGKYTNIKDAKITLNNIHFDLIQFNFFSGTDSQTHIVPQFEYICTFPGKTCQIQFKIEHSPSGQSIHAISDELLSKDFSVRQVLEYFSIVDTDITQCLPEEIDGKILDSPMFHNLEIDFSKDKMQSFFAYVTADEPLCIMDNKISFTPKIFINIALFENDNVVDLGMCGIFKIGESELEARINPKMYEISFGLKENSALDIDAISKLFFDIELPRLELNKLWATMNFRTKYYTFNIDSRDVLKFSAASKNISIENITLSIMHDLDRFSVGFTGLLDICGIKLNARGGYFGNDKYSFSCAVTHMSSISLNTLLSDFFGDTCCLPTSFDFNILTLFFSYDMRKENSFSFDIRAEFCGSDSTLKKLFSVVTDAAVHSVNRDRDWKYNVDISCNLKLYEDHVINCSYQYDNTQAGDKNSIFLSYSPDAPDAAVTFEKVLNAIGFEDIDESWDFITKMSISGVALEYDFVNRKFTGEIKINSGGVIKILIKSGDKMQYRIEACSTAVISFLNIPIAGGMLRKFPGDKNNFSIKNIAVCASNISDKGEEMPLCVNMSFIVFGSAQQCTVYEAKPQKDSISANALTNSSNNQKVFWLKLEKSIAIFTLHRIGLGLEQQYITFLTDASLNVDPLTFNLLGAGIGVDVSDFDMKFYISGFGISFDSDTVSISGALMKSDGAYSGLLNIKTKPFSLFAAAEYSDNASLLAYAVLTANLGGNPSFYVTGLALGFGYNKRLVLPDIDGVAQYPLIQAASGKISQDSMLEELKKYIKDESGQKFLCFGVRFTTYEIAVSFALLTVCFGDNTEIGLLGLSDITMPPMSDPSTQPIAYAQLSLKAQIKPQEGLLGVEARLTSKSYILSKDCHLTGGFAFYMWFAGEHSGDFAITLGGYHPKYEQNKPTHYPDAPRVGFNWKIGEHVNVDGQIYFALTPSAMMAGGRLNMVYTLGNLKAYFVAKADFLLEWKPFHYDIEVGITLGVSYLLDLWCVSKKITVELGADLHIWGPDFSGSAHIDICILSFDIKFGTGASTAAKKLSWQEFCDSFLPKQETPLQLRASGSRNDAGTAPLKIVFHEGLSGKIAVGNNQEITAVRANRLELTVETVLPVTDTEFNGTRLMTACPSLLVKPMGNTGTDFKSKFSVTVTDTDGKYKNFSAQIIKKNMPTALWGGNGELIKDVPCGIQIVSTEPDILLFPVKNYISLEDLYKKGVRIIENAFIFIHPEDLPKYTHKNSIFTFKNTVDYSEIRENRKNYLENLGIDLTEEISMEKYAAQADDYFDEEVLIPS